MSASPFIDLRVQSFPEQKPETKPETKPEKPPLLSKKEDIDSLTSINGLSIAELEKRARPNSYAQSGFLGPNESFKEVLKKDWETVEKYGTTHQELVKHLRTIIDLARKQEAICGEECVTIEYNGQTLCIELLCTRGLQYDIFEPKQEEDRNVDTPEAWNDEIYIKNKNGTKIIVTTGVLSYIREFGFYEGGGDTNRYRVAPEKIMAILNGN